MPHVAFVSLAGLRVRDEQLRTLGMPLPGLSSRRKAVGHLPSLGLLTLAGLTPSEWTCSYHEAGRIDDALADRLGNELPDLVSISALTASVEEAYRLSGALRARGLSTVLGGLHATACPEEAGLHFDSVVVGDGEPVWHDVLRDVSLGTLKRCYRSNRPFDLRRSPVPRYDLLADSKRPRLTLQTQRGCPLSCEFCGASRLLGPFREKPVSNIQRELQAIRAIMPGPTIELADDNTFAGTRVLEPLFDVLERSRILYFTEADWRIGERRDVLTGLSASGCVQVLVGIESLVFPYSGQGSKRAEVSRVMDALQAIQGTGVAVNGCFIVGCDGETRATLEHLAEFILNCPLSDVQITVQTPFPGTALRSRLSEQKRILRNRGWSCYTLFDVTYQPDPLSVEELETGFRSLLKHVYGAEPAKNRSATRRRVWRRHPRFRTCESAPQLYT